MEMEVRRLDPGMKEPAVPVDRAVEAAVLAALVPEAELAVRVKEVVPVLGLEAEPAVEMKEVIPAVEMKEAARDLEKALVAPVRVLAARTPAEVQEVYRGQYRHRIINKFLYKFNLQEAGYFPASCLHFSLFLIQWNPKMQKKKCFVQMRDEKWRTDYVWNCRIYRN